MNQYCGNPAITHMKPRGLNLQIAGWVIVELGSTVLLALVAMLAGIEATMALLRGICGCHTDNGFA